MKKKYELCKIEDRDIPMLCKWFNDPVIGLYMEDSNPDQVYREEDIGFMKDDEVNFYLSFKCHELLIGYASIYEIDEIHKKGEFSFFIGHPDFRGKGLGKTLVHEVVEFAGSKLDSLYCTIHPANIASIKSVEAAGFTRKFDFQGTDLFYEIFLPKPAG